MSVYDYILSVTNSPSLFLIILIGITLSTAALNKLIFGTFVNGVFGVQFSFFFVASVVVHLYAIGAITESRLFHYLVVEVTVFFVLIFFYKRILERKKKELISSLDYYFNKHSATPAMVILLAILVNFLFVPWGGESRIEFQTNYWFSLLRPLITLFYPLLAFGFYVHLHNENKKLATLYLIIIILYSISAGSKASFLITLTIWFFVYRDIYNPNSLRMLKKYSSLALLTIIGAIINLTVLDVDLLKILERLISFGDAAIMLYQASDPTSACSNLSYFSLMHRGLARIFGDPSAVDIDTLFGFALSLEFYGENTFTGPNARVGPYVLCAFPNWSIILFLLMFTIYILMLNTLLTSKRLLMKTKKRLALSLPFVISSINGYMIDYNQGASDMTFIMLFFGFLVVYGIMMNASSPHRKNGDSA